MQNELPILPSDTQTIAELRDLYRAAESRAARLRLLSVSGSELARTDIDTLDDVLRSTADRLALFVGARSAKIGGPDEQDAIPIRAPGQHGDVVATIAIGEISSIEDIPDAEDREAVRMHLDLMGITIDRMRRESEKAVLLSALQEREKSLELLLEQIFTAQEEERRRVSHELHDGVAQMATALVRLLEGQEASASHAKDAIKPAEIARGLVSELRRVIAGLRPTVLDDLGLMAALQSLADALEVDGFTVTVDLAPGGERLSSLVETALYRVAQEAVANIRKHAGGPCEVTIEANFASANGGGVLRIADAGGGPSEATLAESPHGGNNVGIEVMKERMAAIGGTLDWRGARGKGVVVEARLPRKD